MDDSLQNSAQCHAFVASTCLSSNCPEHQSDIHQLVDQHVSGMFATSANIDLITRCHLRSTLEQQYSLPAQSLKCLNKVFNIYGKKYVSEYQAKNHSNQAPAPSAPKMRTRRLIRLADLNAHKQQNFNQWVRDKQAKMFRERWGRAFNLVEEIRTVATNN